MLIGGLDIRGRVFVLLLSLYLYRYCGCVEEGHKAAAATVRQGTRRRSHAACRCNYLYRLQWFHDISSCSCYVGKEQMCERGEGEVR